MRNAGVSSPAALPSRSRYRRYLGISAVADGLLGVHHGEPSRRIFRTAAAIDRHHGRVPHNIPLDRIYDVQDRSWTFALLGQVRSLSISEAERDEVVDTLAMLADYRSVGPLTSMLEDDQLHESVREAAAAVLRAIDDTATAERRRGPGGTAATGC